MKRELIAWGLSLALTMPLAGARHLPTLKIDDMPVNAVSHVQEGTTYVYLRTVLQALLPEAEIFWRNGMAGAETDNFLLTAIPGEKWIVANGRYLYVPDGIQVREGRVLLPIRVLAEAVGATVEWNGGDNSITIVSTNTPASEAYSPDDVYWLSRIISAESRGEVLEGQIAVGNVVLNRVKASDFPDTIYGVIFDARWGGQFEPVRNGTIYHAPTDQSIVAAKLCLEGANTAGESLYFLNPDKANNFWTVYHRPFIKRIGVHDFYG